MSDLQEALSGVSVDLQKAFLGVAVDLQEAFNRFLKDIKDRFNSLHDYLKEIMESGWCGYHRAGRYYIAPCGAAHSCKRRGWTCLYIGDCGRIPSARQKARQRLYIVEWQRVAQKGLRKQQLLKCFTRYYGRMHARNKPKKNGGATHERKRTGTGCIQPDKK